MWDPIPDLLAFRDLAARGEITSAQWFRQALRADTTPNFDLRDPMPAIHYLATTAADASRRRGVGGGRFD